MVENDLYVHGKCWTIFDRVCLKSKYQRLHVLGGIIVIFCKFEQQKYTFWSKLFWPSVGFFFRLKYLPHICGMDLNKLVKWTYGRDSKKNSYQSGNGVNRNVGWLATLPLFHILNEGLGDQCIKIYIYTK